MVLWKIGSRSLVWKNMLQAKDLEDHQILWKNRKGNSRQWFDNWITIGYLYNIIHIRKDWDDKYQYVRDLLLNRTWNENLINKIFLEEVSKKILNKIKPLV